MVTGDTALRLTKANSEKLLITSGIFDFNEAYTVAGWFYLTNDSEQGIISLGPANEWNNSDALQLRSNKYRLLSYKDSVGGTWPPDLGAPSYDQWIYVALVRTSNTSIELHVDGSLLETLPTAVSGRTAAAEFGIGFSEAYYAGIKVKHLKVWTRGLTAAELLAESQQGAPVDPTDLWGYWPLDDGDVSDHSGNNRDFTAYNTPTVEEGPGIPLGTPSIQVFDYSVAGVATPAFIPGGYPATRFDGSTQQCDITNGVLDHSLDLTFMAWVRCPNAVLANGHFFRSYATGPNNILVQWRVGEVLRVTGVNAGSISASTDSSALTTGQWYHLCVVQDVDTLTLYIDGVSAVSTTQTASTRGVSDLTWHLAGRENGNDRLEADFGAVKAWQRALSPGEITRERVSVLPIVRADIYGVWPDANVDISSKGNDWTQVGSPISIDGPGIAWTKPLPLYFDDTDYSVAAVPGTGAVGFRNDSGSNHYWRRYAVTDYNSVYESNAWTVVALFKFDPFTHSGNAKVFTLEGSDNSVDGVYVNGDGDLLGFHSGPAYANYEFVNTGISLTSGQWYSIAYSRINATSGKVFLDGVEAHEFTYDNSARSVTNVDFIVRATDGGQSVYADCDISNLHLYGRALSGNELTRQKHQYLPLRGAIHVYTFKDTSTSYGGGFYDLMGTGLLPNGESNDGVTPGPGIAWKQPLPLYFDDTDYSVAAPTPDYTGAAVFDGGTNYGEITSNLPGNDTDYTLAGWIKLDNLTGNKSIWSQYEHQNNYDTLDCNNENIRLLSRNGGTIYFRTGTIALVADTWHHVAMVKEDNEFSLYVDGVNENIASGTQTVQAAPVSMRFASSRSDVNPFEGSMFGFSLQKRALSDSEIIRQSQQVRPLGPDIAGFWPYLLDDQSGNSRDLTEIGTILRDHDLPDVSWTKPQALQFADYAVAGVAAVPTPDYTGAAVFDGSTNRLERLTDLPEFNDPHTLSIWVKTDAIGAEQQIFHLTFLARTYNRADHLRIDTDGTLQCDARNNTGTAAINSTETLSANTWYHIALVRYSSTSLKVFLDGVEVIDQTADMSGRASTLYLDVAAYYSGAAQAFLEGRMYGLTILAQSSTAAEVVSLMHSVKPNRANLYGFYPYLLEDKSGNSRDLTEVGTILRDHDLPDVAWTKPLPLYFDDTDYSVAAPPVALRSVGALSLSGSGQYGEITSDTIDYNSPYTVAGWVRLTTSPQDCNVWNTQGTIRSYVDQDAIAIKQTRELTVDCFNGGSGGETQGTVLSTNVWYAIAIVRTSVTDLSVYLNGVLDSTITTNVTSRGSGAYSHLGTYHAGGTPQNELHGDLYGWKAWQRTLSSSEISREMQNVMPASWDGIYAVWPYGDEDLSHNTNDWTLIGSPPFISDLPDVSWTKPQALQFADYAVAGVAAAPTPDYTGAAVFDDSSDWCEITSDVMSCESDYTICGFWKPPLSGGNGAIMHLGVAGANRMDAIEVISGQLKLLAYNGSDLINANGSTTFYDAWGHVCLRRTGNTLDAFLDGVLQVTGTVATGVRAATDTMRLASHVDLSGNGTGNAYGWAAWTRALSTSEIQRQSTQVSPVDASDLYEFWPNARTGERFGRDWTENGTITRDHDLPDVSWTKPLPLYFDDTDYSVAATPAFLNASYGTARHCQQDDYSAGSFPVWEIPTDSQTVHGGGTSLTVMMWLRRTEETTGTRYVWVNVPADASDQTRIVINNSGYVQVINYVSWSATTNWGPVLAIGEWVHVTYRKVSDTDWQIVINGEYYSQSSTDLSTQDTTLTSTSQKLLNADQWSTAGYTGDISNFMTFSRALSYGEISRQMRQSTPIVSDCDGAWSLHGNIGSSYLNGILGDALIAAGAGDTTSIDGPGIAWTKPIGLFHEDNVFIGGGSEDTVLNLLTTPINLY